MGHPDHVHDALSKQVSICTYTGDAVNELLIQAQPPSGVWGELRQRFERSAEADQVSWLDFVMHEKLQSQGTPFSPEELKQAAQQLGQAFEDSLASASPPPHWAEKPSAQWARVTQALVSVTGEGSPMQGTKA